MSYDIILGSKQYNDVIYLLKEYWQINAIRNNHNILIVVPKTSQQSECMRYLSDMDYHCRHTSL